MLLVRASGGVNNNNNFNIFSINHSSFLVILCHQKNTHFHGLRLSIIALECININTLMKFLNHLK